MTLLDDIGSSIKRGKQFVTMDTRGGNIFYLIIDRDNKETETVHFLHQVDEANLINILTAGQTEEKPIAYICTKKCAASSIDKSYPICKNIVIKCTERVLAPTIPGEPTEKGNAGAALIVLLVILLADGGMVYSLVLKPEWEQKLPPDLEGMDLEEEADFFTENDNI